MSVSQYGIARISIAAACTAADKCTLPRTNETLTLVVFILYSCRRLPPWEGDRLQDESHRLCGAVVDVVVIC